MNNNTLYSTPVKPTYCPGCGNHSIWLCLQKALAQLKLKPYQVVISYGIGCSGNTANFINTYAIHSMHGRTLPVASGVRLANNKVAVLCVAGDGDSYGIGLNHFVHSCRRNLNITYLAHDNQIYGLTTGQTSPTSEKGFISVSTPQGVIELPINPVALALAADASFVARVFAGRPKHLVVTLKKAIQHRGFAVVDILQPCVTFNKVNTFQYYNERVYELENENWPTNDKKKAFDKALEWGKRIPLGVFYQQPRPIYEDELPSIRKNDLYYQTEEKIDIQETMKQFI